MKSQYERLAENVQHIDVHQMQSQNGPETDSLINSTMPTPGLARDKKAGHLGMWAASKTLTKRFMQIVNCSRESQKRSPRKGCKNGHESQVPGKLREKKT